MSAHVGAEAIVKAAYRLYTIADQVVALPVVTKVVASEPVRPCQIEPIAPDTPQGDVFVCTRTSEEGPVTRTPSCAACLGTAVQRALDAQLAVWVEVPAVVTA